MQTGPEPRAESLLGVRSEPLPKFPSDLRSEPHIALLGAFVVVDEPAEPTAAQRAVVAELLGRVTEGDFCVKVRDTDAAPVVIQNAPFTGNGRPMPTTYWLVDPRLCRAVSRLEGRGGVRQAEQAVAQDDLARLHRNYAQRRDEQVEPGRVGPRPSGGVGGTRRGVKCLHAHLAHLLATGDDIVGEWVVTQLTRQDLL